MILTAEQQSDGQRAYSLTVYGIAAAQGSLAPFRHRTTGQIIVKQPTKLCAWRDLVASEAQRVLGGKPLIDAPVSVSARFFLRRPKSRPKCERWPDRQPDLDKLIRAIGDALEGVCWTQDSRICRWVVEKHYGDPPRVELQIAELDQEDALWNPM